MIDYHVYYDEGRGGMGSLLISANKNNIKGMIVSPSCTIYSEPDKNLSFYKVQQVLLSNNLFRIVSWLISKSFYNKRSQLRIVFRLLTRNYAQLNKVLEPKNFELLNLIKNNSFFKMWFWLNLNNYDEGYIENSLSIKQVAGIKIHLYWHRTDTKTLYKFFKFYSLTNNPKPIYIIMDYFSLSKILKVVKLYPDLKFIIGYGGFPYFSSLYQKVSSLDNVYVDTASNHLSSRNLKKMFLKIPLKKIVHSTDCPYVFTDTGGIFDYSKFNSRFYNIFKDSTRQVLDKIDDQLGIFQ
jgi:hypothetical protein